MVGKPKPPKTRPDFDDAKFKIRGYPPEVGSVLNASAVLREAADDGEFSRGGAALMYASILERKLDEGVLTQKDAFEFFYKLSERAFERGDKNRSIDNMPVVLPYWVLRDISECWNKYIFGYSGLNLGEAFKLEGVSRTASKDKIKNFLRDLNWAVTVLERRRLDQVSLEKAYAQVAEEEGVSAVSVKRAWTRFGKDIEEGARLHGVIE